MNVRSLAIHQLARPSPLRRGRGHHGAYVIRPDALWAAPTATYIICTNPRSGSWLLSEGLASTTLAGNPREWFNVLEEQQHRGRWRMEHTNDLTCENYLRLASAQSTSRNGISGIKLHYYQFAELPARMQTIETLRGLSAPQLMARLFPRAKYIWLTRRDKARQAISYFIASKTGRWWAIKDAASEWRDRDTDEPSFDPQAIARMERRLIDNDSKWQAYFDNHRIAPLIVHYEDVIGDYRGTIVRILRWLGVADAESIDVATPRLMRQSNARSEEWLARYTRFRDETCRLLSVPEPNESTSPAPERMERIRNTVPSVWKRWIGRSKALGMPDDAIVESLTNNGYARAAALAELEAASSDQYLVGAARTLRHLRKATSLLKVQAELARLDPRSSVIERRCHISREEFRDRYYATNRPVILEQLMAGWRALTAWTPAYLKSVAGDRMIEIMTNRDADPKYEVNNQHHRAEMRFADYVDLVYSGRVTNDYYMVANNAFFERPEARPLLEDFTAFPEYLNPATTGRQSFLWFGPAGTVTPLHHDTSNILLAQVAGRKRFRLIPPSQWDSVYNTAGVFSDVDCEKPDLDRHPKFRNATVIDIVIEPGEVFFIPVGWWHHVRALDVSITVSFTNFVFPNHFRWG